MAGQGRSLPLSNLPTYMHFPDIVYPSCIAVEIKEGKKKEPRSHSQHLMQQ